MVARDAHELMRAMEASSIVDCAEMAVTSSLFRTESRWGLYHHRVDHPAKDDGEWFCHTILPRGTARSAQSVPSLPISSRSRRPSAPLYDRTRIRALA